MYLGQIFINNTCLKFIFLCMISFQQKQVKSAKQLPSYQFWESCTFIIINWFIDIFLLNMEFYKYICKSASKPDDLMSIWFC